jgi:ATP-binding cassette subfamily B (MDR/TAP) protein 1
MEMVKQACREAHAEEFISQLPEGYGTFVGEGGIKLSGGQSKRNIIITTFETYNNFL